MRTRMPTARALYPIQGVLNASTIRIAWTIAIAAIALTTAFVAALIL